MKASIRMIEAIEGNERFNFVLDFTPMREEGDDNIEKLADFMKKHNLGLFTFIGTLSGTYSFRIEKMPTGFKL